MLIEIIGIVAIVLIVKYVVDYTKGKKGDGGGTE